MTNCNRVAIISTKATSLVSFRGPLIKSLKQLNLHVYALASDYDPVTRQAVKNIGAVPVDISLSRTGMNPIADLQSILSISRVLSQIKADIVLSYYIKPVIFGTFAAWRAGVPRRVAMIEGLGFVYTDDGRSLSLKMRLLRFMVSGLYRLSLKLAHSVVFLNPDDIRDFESWNIVGPGKAIELGGIGVDLEEWAFKTQVLNPIRFLFIGRLLREKGIEQFVAAAYQVKELYPNTEFVVLGDVDSNPGGVKTEQMLKWVDEGLVLWPGHVSVKPWLEQSSVFVLPSYREGVPRSTQEAMAVGRAVITTDVPGCRQTVDDGVNGFLVPVRDQDELARAMVRFIENPQLIVCMGRESRKMAEERFDVHKVNAKLIDILCSSDSNN